MKQIKLLINRKGSFLNKLMPYEVWFNDIKLGNMFKSKDGNFIINCQKGVLKFREFGSNFAFHTIQKEIIIFPELIKNIDHGIECDVTASINWLGVLTYGLFAPIRNLSIEIKY